MSLSPLSRVLCISLLGLAVARPLEGKSPVARSSPAAPSVSAGVPNGILWDYHLSQRLGAPGGGETLASRVLADGSFLVVIALTDAVTALRLDPATGAPLSRAVVPLDFTAERAVIEPFGTFVVAGSTNAGTSIVRLGPTGRPIWLAPTILPNSSLNGGALAYEEAGRVIVTARTAVSLVTIAYDALTGSTLWGPNTLQAGTVDSSRLAVSTTGQIVVGAIVSDPASPTRWSVATVGYQASSGALLWGPIVTPNATRNRLALAADGLGHAAVSGGAKTITYDIQTGAEQWEIPAAYLLLSYSPSGDLFAAATWYGNSSAGLFGRVVVDRYRSDGARLFRMSHSPQPDGEATPWAIAVDGTGGAFVTMRVSGTPYPYPNPGVAEVFRVDFAGAVLWHRSTSTYPETLAVSPEGDALVAGWNLGATIRVSSRRASDGSERWAAIDEASRASSEQAQGLLVDPAGDVLVTGLFATPSASGQLLALKLHGGSGDVTWGPGSLGMSLENGPAVRDATGNLIQTGNSPLSAAPQGVVLKKSGTTGAVLWGPVSLPIDGGARVAAVAVDAQGDVTLVGRGAGGFLLKLSGATGTVLWGPLAVSFPQQHDGGTLPTRLALDAEGNALVAGFYFAGFNYSSGPVSGPFVAKYGGATGQVVWGPTDWPAGTYASTDLSALAVDAQGNPILAGLITAAFASSKIFAAKCNGATGATLWGPTTFESPGIAPQGLAVDASGDVVVSARVYAPASQFKPAVVKYVGSTGAVAWGTVIPLPDESADSVTQPEVLATGEVLVVVGSTNATNRYQARVFSISGATGAVGWGTDPVSRSPGPVTLGLSEGEPVLATTDLDGLRVFRMTARLLAPIAPLPGALCGLPFTFTLAPRNGAPPYSWSVVGGALPPGLVLASGGSITGTPVGTGVYSFRVRVADSTNAIAEADQSLEIGPGTVELVTIVASPSSACPGTPITLGVPGAWTSFHWLPGNETTPTIQVSPTTPTDYAVTVSDSSGCPRDGVLTVVPTPPAEPLITASLFTSTGSPGNVASASGSPGPFTWSIVNGEITAGQGSAQVEFTAGAPGVLRISAIDTGSTCPAATSARLVTVGGALGFYTLTPCRMFDTRPSASAALPPLGSWVFWAIGICGIPDSAKAISVNLTVPAAAGDGDLRVYAADDPPPASSTINFRAGTTRAVNAIVRLSVDGFGTLAIQNDCLAPTNVILDVNGYFE